MFTQKSGNNDVHSLITAFLIQQLEDYHSLCLLTSNAQQQIDPAFFRRAFLTVSFPPFTAQQRWQLFQKLLIDKGVKVDSQLDLTRLMTRLPMNGSHLKKLINAAVLSATADGTPISDVIISADDLAKALQTLSA